MFLTCYPRHYWLSKAPFGIAFNLPYRYRTNCGIFCCWLLLISKSEIVSLFIIIAQLFAFIIQIKVNEIDAKTRFSWLKFNSPSGCASDTVTVGVHEMRVCGTARIDRRRFGERERINKIESFDESSKSELRLLGKQLKPNLKPTSSESPKPTFEVNDFPEVTFVERFQLPNFWQLLARRSQTLQAAKSSYELREQC